MAESEIAPKFAPFIGMAGICFAMTFGCVGAAYGTAKSGIGIAGVGTFRPDLIMKAFTHPGCHVRYHCRICSGNCCSHSIGYRTSSCTKLQFVQWIHAFGMRSIGRLDGTRGRILDRDSRRYGRTVIHATVEDFRWNGPYSNFWGSLGFIWTHCCLDSQYKEQRLGLAPLYPKIVQQGTEEPSILKVARRALFD